MIDIFVFDTNSLISAHILPNSVTRKAYDKAIEKGILVHSAETFNEFVDTFARPKFDKYLSTDGRLNAITSLELKSQLITVTHYIGICRDPKDNKFLELALSVNANYIITGDKDLLVLNPFENIPIISAAEFLLL
jgi:putative PIN family toxin of toxin-antitoxin system